jgi:hypothetical protein
MKKRYEVQWKEVFSGGGAIRNVDTVEAESEWQAADLVRKKHTGRNPVEIEKVTPRK